MAGERGPWCLARFALRLQVAELFLDPLELLSVGVTSNLAGVLRGHIDLDTHGGYLSISRFSADIAPQSSPRASGAWLD
jgi:hypothetical protein